MPNILVSFLSDIMLVVEIKQWENRTSPVLLQLTFSHGRQKELPDNHETQSVEGLQRTSIGAVRVGNRGLVLEMMVSGRNRLFENVTLRPWLHAWVAQVLLGKGCVYRGCEEFVVFEEWRGEQVGCSREWMRRGGVAVGVRWQGQVHWGLVVLTENFEIYHKRK